MFQEWLCDSCGTHGQVRIAKDADVVTVYNRIADQHEAKRKEGQCYIPRIRARNSVLCSKEEWQKEITQSDTAVYSQSGKG